MRSPTYAILVSGQALIYAFCRSYCCGLQKNYFSVFPKMKLVSFTCDPRWFPGQSLGENFFQTPNAVDRSYRHCHLNRLFSRQCQCLGKHVVFVCPGYFVPSACGLLLIVASKIVFSSSMIRKQFCSPIPSCSLAMVSSTTPPVLILIDQNCFQKVHASEQYVMNVDLKTSTGAVRGC